MMKKVFKNHVATIDDSNLETLTWMNPGDSCYMINYIIRGGVLFVSGDVGEAIYRWSSPITFEWLSKVDIENEPLYGGHVLDSILNGVFEIRFGGLAIHP